MNSFRVGCFFVNCVLFLFCTVHSHGSVLHDSMHLPAFEEFSLPWENQIKNIHQLSSYVVEAQNPEEFDQVKITRFSNDDYSATYRFRNKIRYRVFYQPMNQKVILITHNASHNSSHNDHNAHNTLDEIIQDKGNIEIQLDYTHYDPLNVHFNVARMVSSGFVQHLKQAINCTEQPSEPCSTGYITKTETYNHYQPYSPNPVSLIEMTEEPGKSTRITMDGEEVSISSNGSGIYRQTRATGRQHANQEQTQPGQAGPQPSTSSTVDANTDRATSGSTASGKLPSSGDDGDDDPDKRRRQGRKAPDDYQDQEMPSGTSKLTPTQLMQYLLFINGAITYQIDKEVDIDPIMADLLRLWADQPRELALGFRNYLRNWFGVSQVELAVLEDEMNRVIEGTFSTFAYVYRNCEESYYCTALLNAYLAELNRHHPGLAEGQLAIVSDLLTQTFGQIIAFNRINELQQLINQQGFCLPQRLKETKNAGGCQGAYCGLTSYCPGVRFADAARRVFGTHSAVMAFSTLILSYVYFNQGAYFDSDVDVDELLVFLMSGFSTGASIVASALNTVSLCALLKTTDCFSTQNIMVLGGLNTLKDLFTIIGLIFGMMLPDQPENLRLCQVLNGLFGAAFPAYLLHNIRTLYNSRSDQPSLMQRRDVCIGLISIFATMGLYGGSHILGAFSECQADSSTFFTTGITSLSCNLFFPRDSAYAEAVRLGSYFASASVFIALWAQHAIIREITSQTDPAISSQLQHVEAMRRPLNTRAVISVLTLLGSFFNRFGNNPLSFWWIPLLDTGKSIYFEAAVQALRELVIAVNIYGLKTNELKQAFREAVNRVEILPGMTMAEYIEKIYEQFDQACIRTKRSSSNWVRNYATHDKFQVLLELSNRNEDEGETHVARSRDQEENRVQIHNRLDIFTPPAIPDAGETGKICCNGACNCATSSQNESEGKDEMENSEDDPLFSKQPKGKGD